MPELQTPVVTNVATRPRLALVGMHIRGLKAIEQFDLPGDGLGWRGEIPELVLLAGINGSGKTTLLNFIVACLSLLRSLGPGKEKDETDLATLAEANEAWVDFELELDRDRTTRMRFAIGDSDFLQANQAKTTCQIRRENRSVRVWTTSFMDQSASMIGHLSALGSIPSVIFLPSENRALSLPNETYKTAGSLIEDRPFVHRWQPPPSGRSRWRHICTTSAGRI